MALESTPLTVETHPEPPAPPALAPFYYLDNFLELINSVTALYDDLLSDPEKTYTQTLLALPRQAQALYVRLLTRRGDYFRMGKLRYREIPDKFFSITQLKSAGLLRPAQDIPMKDLFRLFTKAEWLTLFAESGLKSLNKRQLEETMLARTQHSNLQESIQKATCESIIQLQQSEVFTAFKLLYFANGRQDLSDFILNDLGIYRYENYALHKAGRLFQSRAQIDDMLHYYQHREKLETLAEYSAEQLIEYCEQLPAIPRLSSNASNAERMLKRRIQRLTIAIARQLERLGELTLALNIYERCDQPPSRERQARILKKQARPAQALGICEELLQSGSDTEQQFARQFAPALRKQLKISSRDIPAVSIVSESLCLPLSSHGGVEAAVARYIGQQGECYFVENTLFLSVFGLVYWPVFFADIPGAFSHRFQSAPHDLYQDDFLRQRQAIKNRCWQQFTQQRNRAEYLVAFARQKVGISNPFIAWPTLSLPLLEKTLQRVPLEHWQNLFDRLWQNLQENRNGLPDLIFFPSQGGYQLVEVKGPGDKLQRNQIRWLEFFDAQAIPAKVVYVTWQP